MTEWLLENLKAPNILLKTYNRSFGNKELFIRLTTSSGLWDTVQSSCKSVLSHHPMHSPWKKMCSALVVNQISKIFYYLAQNTFLWCYLLLTNYSTGKIRKTLHFHFLVFLSLRNIVRLRNSYGEPPVKMLAVMMHINFHHCLMSIFMLGRESLFTYWWEQQKDTSL